ncbi:MAG: hypothetical protein WC297_01830 [Candidatus Paceibacterota bacterium]|jgi:hypothetical protein
MPKGVSVERLLKDARRVLENPFWIPEIETGVAYRRVHDDHDGTEEGMLIVTFSLDGDAWVTIDKHHGPSLRFRNYFGGGNSPRTRNALMLLALAIKLDEAKEDKRKRKL